MPDFGFDDWMDAELRNVSVPRDLDARLRASRPSPEEVAAAQGDPHDPGDARMDAVLRNVQVPAGLHRRLHAIPHRSRLLFLPRAVSQRAWAAAASLLILASAGAYLATVRQTGRPEQPNVAVRSPAPTSPERGRTVVVQSDPAGGRARTAHKSTRQTPVTVPLGQPQLAEGESYRLLENVAGVGASIRQAIEAKMRAEYALGAGGKIEQLPDLEVLERPIDLGVSPPRVRGYDMLFQLRHGEHPFVSPGANAALETSRVPFTFRTASYDRATASIAEGHLPAGDEVRVEDFLAAQQYALPSAPQSGLALHVAGCPAPFGETGKHVLQIAVQAARARRSNQKPTRVIAVVDTSSAMQAGARQVGRAGNVEARSVSLAGRQVDADWFFRVATRALGKCRAR